MRWHWQAFFVITAGIGLRERLITVILSSLKHAIAVGIGLSIAMVGLQWAGVIVDSPGTLVTLGDLRKYTGYGRFYWIYRDGSSFGVKLSVSVAR